MSGKSISLSGLVLAFVLFLPQLSAAQSGIAGVVRDTSGAVLPGVTVEASSPVLIEKVRTVVTSDDGSYTIVDLRPGVYTVTFSLTGFSTIRRAPAARDQSRVPLRRRMRRATCGLATG